jgi:hypothetical protein
MLVLVCIWYMHVLHTSTRGAHECAPTDRLTDRPVRRCSVVVRHHGPGCTGPHEHALVAGSGDGVAASRANPDKRVQHSRLGKVVALQVLMDTHMCASTCADVCVLESACWSLRAGACVLESACWSLRAGVCMLESACWSRRPWLPTIVTPSPTPSHPSHPLTNSPV